MPRAHKQRRLAVGQPCPYCCRTMERLDHPRLAPTRDHVVPESRGGKEVIVACMQCNTTKADMLPDQWEAFMASNPGWWKLSKHELRLVLMIESVP
jgi:5-methylcytosine-specific restriction endonuclease McrA